MEFSNPNNIVKLSDREKEILYLIVNECTSKEIAKKLFISVDTVKSHRAALLNKLNVKNVAGMVRVACYQNLLDLKSN